MFFFQIDDIKAELDSYDDDADTNPDTVNSDSGSDTEDDSDTGSDDEDEINMVSRRTRR